MQQRVKQFIEDHIAEIDLHRWEEVFDEWYQETTTDDFWSDDRDFLELHEVLVYVLDIDKQTLKDARATVINKYTEDIVTTYQHNNYNRIGPWNISWNGPFGKLKSLLGFSREDIFLIFNELDMSGVTPDYNKQRFVIDGI